ncbi:MAG: type II toxin-antitoxin system PemK/MazF family toxin [Bacteroidota bacterium]
MGRVKTAQYDLLIVNLDPTMGSEIKKTRPCVVISPDELNRHLRTIVIAPITSQERPYPTRVPAKVSGKAGWIIVEQIRTIDKRRVRKNIGKLAKAEVKQLKQVIRQTFVDD